MYGQRLPEIMALAGWRDSESVKRYMGLLQNESSGGWLWNRRGRDAIRRMKIKLELTKKQVADLRQALVCAMNQEHPGLKYRKLDTVIQRALVRSANG